MATSAPGKIITFYSYKGGTGRSMALANVAWVLASHGKRVLAVDWDLEAPGLHRYFHPFLSDPSLASSPGVINMVADYEATVTQIQGRESVTHLDEQWYEQNSDILDYVTELKGRGANFGALHFIPAGKQSGTYAELVNRFNWRQLFDNLGGAHYFDAVKKKMRAEYDYVLIDSRTGVSDTSGLCTVQLPDALVVCFTLNTQGIQGAGAIAKWAATTRTATSRETFQVFPVPTRIERAEKRKLDRAREAARLEFDGFPAHLDIGERDRYWGRIELAYEPFYAYEEILAIFGDRPGQVNSLLASFERLTGYISEHALGQLGPLAETERREILSLYERGTNKKDDPAQHARTVMARLSPAQEAQARRILLRLVDPTVVGAETRRIVPASQLERDSDAVLALLVSESLVSRRVVEGREYIEFPDETLLQCWPLLRGWIHEAREFLAWRVRLSAWIDVWAENQHDSRLILRGSALAESSRYLEASSEDLNETEREYIKTSQSESKSADEELLELETRIQSLEEIKARFEAEREEKNKATEKQLKELNEFRTRLEQERAARDADQKLFNERRDKAIRWALSAAVAFGIAAIAWITIKPFWEQYQIQRSWVIARHPTDDQLYVRIPAGSFLMGCVPSDQECKPDERPQHPIGIRNDLWIGRTEVTVGAYRIFAKARYRGVMPPAPAPSKNWAGDDYPIVNVNWFESLEYCGWVGGRLPTEAEWEYAARGSMRDQIYSSGASISIADANYAGSRTGRRAPVGSTAVFGKYGANRFGLYDMSGNASEWIADAYDPYYYNYTRSVSPAVEPFPASVFFGNFAVRGGSWLSEAKELRLSARSYAPANLRSNAIGFRCVIDGSDLANVAKSYHVNPFDTLYNRYLGESWYRYWYSLWRQSRQR